MSFHINHHFGVLAFAAVINILVANMAWQRRGSTLACRYFSLMMVAATFYAAVAAMEAGSTAVSDKIFWSTLEYVGTGGVIVFFLLFSEAFVYERSQFNSRHLLRLSVWPLLNIILVATNGWHHWIWVDITPGAPPNYVAIYEHGVGYFWILACLYLYGLRSIQLLAQSTFRGSPLRRRQSLFLLLGALFPYLGSALYSLNLAPAGLNLAPMSFMGTGIFSFWALFRMGAFDAIPVAREMLIEHLQDGVMVVDLQHHIVDINPQGRSLTGLKSSCMGRSLHSALADLPDLLRNYDRGIEIPFGLWLGTKKSYYVTVQISPLQDGQGKNHGRLLVFHDITQRYQAEVELRQANNRLQSQLQEIEFLQTKLETQARQDQLTGLFNRHYLNEILPQALQQAGIEHYPIAFVMLDIDHFKRVNETFGHRAGDLVIHTFSQILFKQIGTGDVPCRLGGEEFLGILPGMTLDAGFQWAEIIRQSFEAAAVFWRNSEVKTTVSGGVAIFPDHGTQDDDLLHAVDLALYDAKKAGRNQVICFNHLVH